MDKWRELVNMAMNLGCQKIMAFYRLLSSQEEIFCMVLLLSPAAANSSDRTV
jgi:hypothetical protein